MDRLRDLSPRGWPRWLCLGAALTLSGCPKDEPGATTQRFEGVSAKPAPSAARFCDKIFPGDGQGARPFAEPATRPLPGVTQDDLPKATGWRWINLWATWCGPCVEEMGLLGRWKDAFAKDGPDVRFELFSVDEPDAQAALKGFSQKKLPGAIRWVRSAEDHQALLGRLGVEKDAPIPLHLLVDPKGMVRCVRVGAIHEQDFGAVKALVSAP